MALAILGMSLLFFMGHFFRWLFQVTKVPDLLVLVLLGFVLKQLGLVTEDDFGKTGQVLSTLALIVILYHGGMTLKAGDLLGGSIPALLISLLGFGASAVTGLVMGTALAFQSWQASLLFGLAIGSTSSAIVIPMVKSLSISDEMKTILSLESSFTDVLVIVVSLVLIDGFIAGQVRISDILIGVGPKAILAVGVGLLLSAVWATLKKAFPFIREVKFAGEAWAALSFATLEMSGLNGALGALALGFGLANLGLLAPLGIHFSAEEIVSEEEQTLLNEVAFLLRTFFFLYLGIMLRLTGWNSFLFALIATALIFTVRILMARFLLRGESFERLDRFTAFAMGPRGLACAVIATIPLQRGLPEGQWILDSVFSVIPITILATSVLVIMVERGVGKTFFNKLIP